VQSRGQRLFSLRLCIGDARANASVAVAHGKKLREVWAT
jgi:hypothetical protein